MKRVAILIYNAINIFYVLKTIDQGTCPFDIRLDDRIYGWDACILDKQVCNPVAMELKRDITILMCCISAR